VLTIEAMEGRMVLSIAPIATAAVPAALVRGGKYLYLHGSGQGTFSQAGPPIPDLGVTDALKGTAHLGRLGRFKVSGSLAGTGFIFLGQATGTLTLVNARGSVTVALAGPPQGGFQSPQSGTYTFAIRSGTGAYARASGTGKVDLELGSGTFKMTFRGDPNRF
jgi:hypothetical protein